MNFINSYLSQHGNLSSRRLLAAHPMWRFTILYLLQLAIFNIAFFLIIIRSSFFATYLHINAKVSGWILDLFGQVGVQASGSLLATDICQLNIKQGCDGLQALVIFLAGIIAFPAPWRRKASGLVLGALFLLALNIVRIVTLYYAMAYRPVIFDTLHIDIWQPVYILLALLTWYIWVLSVLPGKGVVHS